MSGRVMSRLCALLVAGIALGCASGAPSTVLKNRVTAGHGFSLSGFPEGRWGLVDPAQTPGSLLFLYQRLVGPPGDSVVLFGRRVPLEAAPESLSAFYDLAREHAWRSSGVVELLETRHVWIDGSPCLRYLAVGSAGAGAQGGAGAALRRMINLGRNLREHRARPWKTGSVHLK